MVAVQAGVLCISGDTMTAISELSGPYWLAQSSQFYKREVPLFKHIRWGQQ